MVWSLVNFGGFGLGNRICGLLELSEKMKVLICFLFLSASVVATEWIEPPARSAKGYLVPTPDYNPIFPKDHGAHREYGLEWWYWVGHLKSDEGEESYGFQSTVFRVAGDPNYASGLGKHAFGNRQLFLAHAALSDLANKNYIHHESCLLYTSDAADE